MHGRVRDEGEEKSLGVTVGETQFLGAFDGGRVLFHLFTKAK